MEHLFTQGMCKRRHSEGWPPSASYLSCYGELAVICSPGVSGSHCHVHVKADPQHALQHAPRALNILCPLDESLANGANSEVTPLMDTGVIFFQNKTIITENKAFIHVLATPC